MIEVQKRGNVCHRRENKQIFGITKLREQLVADQLSDRAIALRTNRAPTITPTVQANKARVRASSIKRSPSDCTMHDNRKGSAICALPGNDFGLAEVALASMIAGWRPEGAARALV